MELQKHHAHWSCSNGATGNAMLLACLHAVKLSGRVSLDDLQRFQLQIFGSVSLVTSTNVEEGGGEEERESVDFVIKRLREDAELTFEALVERLTQHDCSDFRTFELYKAAVQKLREVRRRTREVDAFDDDAELSAFYVVSVLWCFEMLDVQSISYSPLRLGTDGPDPSRRQEKLLLGMNVVPVSSSEAFFSDCAITLLRVLSPNSPGSTPALSLSSVSRGYDTSRMLEVTLTLGALLEERTIRTINHPHRWTVDRMILLEANIDDMTAEHLQFCVERLLAAGAADAWTTPIIMKKGRGAHTLHCLCQFPLKDELLQVMFRHSTTLGVRQQTVDRAALHRQIVTVQTEWKDAPNDGRVDVKVAYFLEDDAVISMKGEYEQCREISVATNIPINRIADQAVRLAHEQIKQLS